MTKNQHASFACACASAIATVPQLKTVLARVLPILGSIKQENMKWVVATSMCKFCDAVVTYVADIDKVRTPRQST